MPPSVANPPARPGLPADVVAALVDAGAGPAHVARVARVWLSGGDPAGETGVPGFALPKRVREALPAIASRLDALVALRSRHPSPDGAARLLLGLADGAAAESVLLPRAGLCVSVQVGCAVGCAFCMTGQGGLERPLSAAEIVAQVALGRRLRPVRRVVYMGMGDALHNPHAVLESLSALGGDGGIGHKELVVSTVGDLGFAARLAAHDVKPALALSLHSTFAERRRRLLPRAPRVEPAELLAEAADYADATGHPLQLQWTLLAGVNDGDDEIERLVPLVRGRRVAVNLIPYNPVPGLHFVATPGDRAHEMTRTLHRHGIVAKLRRSRGPHVDAACGQLRRRAMAH